MHSPTSLLVRVCEKKVYQFAKTPIEHGAEVRVHGVTVRALEVPHGVSLYPCLKQ